MKFGVTTGAAGRHGPRELAELAALAERHGWDGFFLEDYLVYQGRAEVETYDPWICLAAMAAATTRIRLGLTVTPMSRRRPWVVAAQAVTIDHLSAGRFVLGVGSGDPTAPDFSATADAASPRVLAERLDEALVIIDALWRGEPVRFSGRHYWLNGFRLAARPIQRPRIPIWVGGNLASARVRRRVARWDGSCAFYRGPDGNEIEPRHVAVLLDAVRTERGDLDGFAIKTSGSDDPERIAALCRAGTTWWSRWLDPSNPDKAERAIRAGPPVIP